MTGTEANGRATGVVAPETPTRKVADADAPLVTAGSSSAGTFDRGGDLRRVR